MKVLLTGVLGFIGSYIAARLLNFGFEVVGFDNLSNPSLNPTDRIKAATGEAWNNFKFYKQDIRDLDSMLSICANEKPDVIVHMAALGSIARSFANPAETIDVNERGFANMLCLASAMGIKRIIFASSSNVYGDSKKLPKREGEEGRPMNPYGLSKRQNEILARIWHDRTGVEFIGLRFFNVYGPGQNPYSPYAAVIPRFILAEEKLVITGDGSKTRDFTYVADVAEAVHIAIYSPNVNVCLNVGAGKQTSIKQLADMIKGSRSIEYVEDKPGEIDHSVASTDNLRRILDFSPKTTIREGLKKTMETYHAELQAKKRTPV